MCNMVFVRLVWILRVSLTYIAIYIYTCVCICHISIVFLYLEALKGKTLGIPTTSRQFERNRFICGAFCPPNRGINDLGGDPKHTHTHTHTDVSLSLYIYAYIMENLQKTPNIWWQIYVLLLHYTALGRVQMRAKHSCAMWERFSHTSMKHGSPQDTQFVT